MSQIGTLVRAIPARELLKREGPVWQVKYGPRVDQDELTTDVTEWDASGRIGTVKEYPWDVYKAFPSIEALVDALTTDAGTVYRAHLSLGELRPEIVETFARASTEETPEGLWLSDLGFDVGPQILTRLGSEDMVFAGWMGLSISGQGYFYPRKHRHARELVEKVELIGQLVDGCRSIWPVERTAPSPAAIAARQRSPDMWLYDDFLLPYDWQWFASES